MEYAFRNSFKDEPCRVILTETHIVYCEANREVGIPYQSIIEVQIDKGADFFKTTLHSEKGNTYLIGSRFYRSEAQFDDQSRAYSTFIRVLHFHLKDKSRAVYTSGRQPARIGVAVSISMIISFAIAFGADTIGFRFIDPFWEGLGLAGVAAIVIVILNLGHWPRHYSPSDIPLEFLP